MEVDLERIAREKNLEHLVSIAIASNNLTAIPRIPNLSKLEQLYLNHNELTQVDFGLLLDNLPSLQTLLLNNNRIVTLHPAKEPHQKLIHLSLSCNQLRSCDGFPELPNLITLGLFSNDLGEEEVFTMMQKAPKVSDLYVLGNRIQPEGIARLPPLEYLDGQKVAA